jgi:23S rRNA (guanosine2251-2'-O)-methyltransferase
MKEKEKDNELLFGINSVEAALTHDAASVLEVLVEQGTHNARVKELAERARELEIAVHHRPREFLDRASGGTRHQGIAARYEGAREYGDADLAGLIEGAGASALLLVLDGVQDPHNLGACLRSAAGAGVTAVVVPKDRAVGITPTVRKASAGAAERVPLVRVTNLARAMDQIKEAGVWVTGLEGDAPQSLYKIDFKGPVAIVLGGEGEGMRRLTRERCDHLARIPIETAAVESLNVSVATGIALFEARRQRGAV